jgi:hypothetical protein
MGYTAVKANVKAFVCVYREGARTAETAVQLQMAFVAGVEIDGAASWRLCYDHVIWLVNFMVSSVWGSTSP